MHENNHIFEILHTPKKRSLLSDQAIDDLIFEREYFENEEWTYI